MQAGFQAYRALGYQQAAAGVFDTAKALATAGITIPAGAALVYIKCEAQAIRMRDDGTAPTAGVGYPLAVATEFVYTAAQLSQLQIIAQVAGAVLNFWFYG